MNTVICLVPYDIVCELETSLLIAIGQMMLTKDYSSRIFRSLQLYSKPFVHHWYHVDVNSI